MRTLLRPSSLLLLLPLTAAATSITHLAAAQERDGRGGRGDRQPEEETETATAALPEGWEDLMQWRSIGPANMSGRITTLAVHPEDRTIWWAGTAGAGLLKTVNGGTTFEHQFTHEAVGSVGALAVAPSDPDTLYLGTGECNPRNSVSWGNGIYRSRDGGESWEHIGLEDSFQVGDIVVHPEDANVVYVGALGRLWGPNGERGLFKTTDGGETWEQVLFVDELTGVIEVELHPENPDVMLVATYERERDEFCTNDPAKKWGEGSGLHRSTDGGATFTEITEGLPTGTLGRIGLDWYEANPEVVWMVLESERIAQQPEDAAWAGLSAEDADVGARITAITDGSPAAAAGLQVGDIVISVDGSLVHSYSQLLDQIRSHLAGETVGMSISRDREGQELEITFERRPEEKEDQEGGERRGRGERSPFDGGLGGQVENVQHQQGPDGHEFGGIYRSEDGGQSWTRVNSLNPRPMYYSEIRVDPTDESNVYVLGTSLYRSKDRGATFTGDGGRGGVHVDHHAMWIDPTDTRHMILGNDGGLYETRDRMENWEHHNKVAIGQFYHVTTDSELDYKVYGGLQDNGSWGASVRAASGGGPGNEDWMRIGGGDGFICRVDAEDPDQLYYESQNGGLGMRNLRTGESSYLKPRAPRGEQYRWNWRTPYLLSSHNSRIWYAAGNHVFRSLDRGKDARAISPDISRTERGSATALAESPRNPDELWVGTDDGALWSTSDGGGTWTNHFEGRVILEESIDVVADAIDLTAGERTIAASSVEASATKVDDAAPATIPADLDGPGGEKAQPDLAMPLPVAPDESWSGTWSGRIEGATLADGGTDFRLDLSRGEDGTRTGSFASDFGSGDLRGVELDEDTGALEFRVTGRDAQLDFTGKLLERHITGRVTLAGGLVEADLSARPAAMTEPGVAAVEAGSADEAPAAEEAVAREPAAGAEAPASEAPTPEATSPEATSPEATAKATAEPAAQEEARTIDARQEGGRRRGLAPRPAPGEERREEEQERVGMSLAELVPEPFRVSEIVASRHTDDVTYVSFDGHRSDNDLPHIVMTTDGGESWVRISDGLPAEAGSVRTIEEDRVNPDLLWAGTEFGVWISLDRGGSWQRVNANLPTVSVHALAQHPTWDHVVAGTHGRSLWVLDATILRQMTTEALARPVTLFEPADSVQWRSQPGRGSDGMQGFEAEAPGSSASVAYHLAERARSVSLSVLDAEGEVLVELEAGGEAGLHQAEWDLRLPAPEGSRWRWRRRAQPGTYTIALEVDGTTYRSELELRQDPGEEDASYLEYEWQALLVDELMGEEEDR